MQLKLQVVCSLRTVPDPVAHSPRYTLLWARKTRPSPRNSTDSSVPAWPFAVMRQLSPQPTHRPAGRTDSSSSPSRMVRSVMALPHHFMHGGSLDGGSATSLSTRPYSMQAKPKPHSHALHVEQSTERPAVKFHLARALRCRSCSNQGAVEAPAEVRNGAPVSR